VETVEDQRSPGSLVVGFLAGRVEVPFATIVTTGTGALCLIPASP
jgi:hypothetical protein